ncbi:MAG: hypothetical protein Kow0047_26160 [Anaerolineae bacterium]
MLANLQRIGDVPMGYAVIVVLGITSGLIAGTNSFSASDLRQFNALDGMALGMSIGGIEMLAYTLATAATAGISLYRYGPGYWHGDKIRSWREIRLSRAELCGLLLAIALLIVAAYHETVMAAYR